MKILAAMSGGVDSSVATARAVEAGHDVTGVYLALHANLAATDVPTGPLRGCGNPQDRRDAERVAQQLGVDFHVWDYAEEFSRIVIQEFLDRYAAGQTPNPCVFCNEHVKFAVLQNYALEHGFDAVATGHYAQLLPHVGAGSEPVELHRAAYRSKDQSYVLSAIGNEMLSHALFPLGGIPSKDAVREEAARRGLPVSAKAESFDICFIPDGDTLGFLRARLGAQPGEIRDEEGRVLGEHTGAIGYTIGQRKGLGLTVPAADGRPRYVLDVNVKSNVITVGPKEALALRHIEGEQPVWLAEEIDASAGVEAVVQVRAHGREVPATVRIDGDGVRAEQRMIVDLHEEVRGLPRGQSVVVYLGSRVIGQSVVARTWR
ncbi:MAG: tRNA 2-thiouridine(34) synthase MnmA [Arcanobacterium sp.]|nr:tRNA 2-thiouridine(34) synthase MnmA [Arcanobacterium sp.]MDY5589461.1 tRNA 2-thiouridine(34) synthase MnmA [Arcanobacterium sp.]